jgi:serine/threonine protein kinase
MSVKIADLGEARILFADQAAETFCGTPYFRAPEVY